MGKPGRRGPHKPRKARLEAERERERAISAEKKAQRIAAMGRRMARMSPEQRRQRAAAISQGIALWSARSLGTSFSPR